MVVRYLLVIMRVLIRWHSEGLKLVQLRLKEFNRELDASVNCKVDILIEVVFHEVLGQFSHYLVELTEDLGHGLFEMLIVGCL